MKKQILSIASIALVAGALVMSGCKKDDITAPEITLVGDATVNVDFKGTYQEYLARHSNDYLNSNWVVANKGLGAK